MVVPSAGQQCMINIEVIFKPLPVYVTALHGVLQGAAGFLLVFAVTKPAFKTPGLEVVETINDF